MLVLVSLKFSSVVCTTFVSSKSPIRPPIWSMCLMLEAVLKYLVIFGCLSVSKSQDRKIGFWWEGGSLLSGEPHWRINKPGVSHFLEGLPHRTRHFPALEGENQPGLRATWEMSGQKGWEVLQTGMSISPSYSIFQFTPCPCLCRPGREGTFNF